MAGQVEKILRHCGCWEEPARGPPAVVGLTIDRDAVQEALTELSRVPIEQFFAEW